MLTSRAFGAVHDQIPVKRKFIRSLLDPLVQKGMREMEEKATAESLLTCTSACVACVCVCVYVYVVALCSCIAFRGSEFD